MNKIVKDQLKKCNYCDLSNYNEETNSYLIPKVSGVKLEKNKEYIIELSDKAFDSNYYVNINWNKGRAPKSKYYNCEVFDITGKIARISGVSYDPETDLTTQEYWNGFVSIDHINVIKEL